MFDHRQHLFHRVGLVVVQLEIFIVVPRLSQVILVFKFIIYVFLLLLAFRLSRPLRAAQRPRYISFYQSKIDTPEIIVTMQEVKQWLKKKTTNIFTHTSIPLKHQQWYIILLFRILLLQSFLLYSYEPNSTCVQMEFLPLKRIISPIPSLSVSIKDQSPFVYMSPRRAGCKYLYIL